MFEDLLNTYSLDGDLRLLTLFVTVIFSVIFLYLLWKKSSLEYRKKLIVTCVYSSFLWFFVLVVIIWSGTDIGKPSFKPIDLDQLELGQ